MKILRYPKTNIDQLEEVDSFEIGSRIRSEHKEVNDKLKFLASFDCNISLDQMASRKSRIIIELNRDDLEQFHLEYLRIIEMEKKHESKRTEDLIKELKFNKDLWSGLSAKFGKCRLGLVGEDEFFKYLERISDSMSSGTYDRITYNDLNEKKVPFNSIVYSQEIKKFDDALAIIRTLCIDYWNDLQKFFFSIKKYKITQIDLVNFLNHDDKHFGDFKIEYANNTKSGVEELLLIFAEYLEKNAT